MFLPIAVAESLTSSCGLAPRERRFLPRVTQHDYSSRRRSLFALLSLGRWTGPQRNKPRRHISFLPRSALTRPSVSERCPTQSAIPGPAHRQGLKTYLARLPKLIRPKPRCVRSTLAPG